MGNGDSCACATEVEGLPRIFRHPVDLCHKVEAPAIVTCVDGHGWPRREGLYASDLLAGHADGAAIELETPQVRAGKVPQVGMAQDNIDEKPVWRRPRRRSLTVTQLTESA